MPELQALVSTGVCWSEDGALFRTDPVADLRAALSEVPRIQLVDELRIFDEERDGVLLPASTGTVTVNRSTQFLDSGEGYADLSYCWSIPQAAGVDTSRFARFPGVVALLTEHHASGNVGHAMRDASFLARLLHMAEEAASERRGKPLPISFVLVQDNMYVHRLRQGWRSVPFRIDSLAALMAGAVPAENIAYYGDAEANATFRSLFDPRQHEGVCFDVVVQRLREWSFDHGYYRRKAWEFCGVDKDWPLDTFFIEVHGMKDKDTATRKWQDLEGLVNFVKNHSVASGLTVLAASLENNVTFCDQVRLYARSKVVFMHHGAAVAANSAFIRPESVMVEVMSTSECFGTSEEEKYCVTGVGNTENREFARYLGIRYIGAKVVIPTPTGTASCPLEIDYIWRTDCELRVNYTGLDLALHKVMKLLDVPYTGTPVPVWTATSTTGSALFGTAWQPSLGYFTTLEAGSHATPHVEALALLVVAQAAGLCWCLRRRRRLTPSAAVARPCEAPSHGESALHPRSEGLRDAVGRRPVAL